MNLHTRRAAPERHSSTGDSTLRVAVIEQRHLLRDWWMHCFTTTPGYDAFAVPSIESWIESRARFPASVILMSMVGRADDEHVQRQISCLGEKEPDVPIVLVSDNEGSGQILRCLALGVRGYISTSVSMDVAINAVRLVAAGGLYIPASTIAPRNAPDPSTAPGDSILTARQASVAEALRRGKSNKVIAYELTMCESTVKVHVKNIMKKLKARNRTEAALKLSKAEPVSFQRTYSNN